MYLHRRPADGPADGSTDEPADGPTSELANESENPPASEPSDPQARQQASRWTSRQTPPFPRCLPFRDCGCWGGGGVDGVAAVTPLRFPTRLAPARLQWQSPYGGGKGEGGDGGTCWGGGGVEWVAAVSPSSTTLCPASPLPRLLLWWGGGRAGWVGGLAAV
ncbi:unnamed protein product [Closterium sp. Naga37s-1]|nr:unnamed protein product [Closterium sp. Naga37s-1]